MHLLFSQWFSPSLIQALGWTLVHSLWQGILAAITALVILWLTKKSSPLLRYNVLLFVFTLFIVAVITTLSFQYNNIESAKPDEITSSTLNNQPFTEGITSFTIAEQTKNYLSGFENFFNTHASFIVAIWFFIFCIQCLKLCSSLGYIYRIRNYKTNFPSANWQQRCEQLKNLIGIKKSVALLESGIVKVPVVVGFIKPLILLPVGLIANLPYNQVESILLHELAHIRRRDYLVNVLQSFVEIIFFFNPAILWVSSLIKEEREACCDEMAVNYLDSKSDYIRALVSFQEYAMHSPGYAMAFPGKRNSLLQRVKRIINNENKKLTSMEKTILFCGIIAITSFGILSNKNAKAQKNILSRTNQLVTGTMDTIPKSNGQNISKTASAKKPARTQVMTDNDGNKKTIVLETTEENGRQIKAKLQDNKITELFINNEVINSKEYENYESEVKSIIDKQRAEAEISNQKASQRISEKAQANNEHQQITQREKQLIQKTEQDQKLKEGEVKITYKRSDSGDTHQEVEDILEVLKKNNIIKGKDGTTFKLNNDELLVNGIKQSAELHQVLKQRYINKGGDYYTFSSSSGTTDITVHRE